MVEQKHKKLKFKKEYQQTHKSQKKVCFLFAFKIKALILPQI